jgi:hypothetical protein
MDTPRTRASTHWDIGETLADRFRAHARDAEHLHGAHIDELHAALAVAPQTNEVGRSIALLAGLFDLVGASGVRRIRLLELGASAGLNLLLDCYAFRGKSWHFGSLGSSSLTRLKVRFSLNDL